MMGKTILLALVFLLVTSAHAGLDNTTQHTEKEDLSLAEVSQSALADMDPIVYVRCKRTTETYDLTGEITVDGVTKTITRTMTHLDGFDKLPDVVNFLSGFAAPCDLVYRESSGAERILYNCSDHATDQNACAAMDPAVSFDGKTIAFTVFRGPLGQNNVRVNNEVLDPNADEGILGRFYLPSKRLQPTEAQLHLVDVATGSITPLPFIEGEYDSGPAFLANGQLAFTSTRDQNKTTMVFRTNATSRGTRIWNMDLDGKNIDLASHHSTSKEEHPYPLKDGRLAYSSWQIFGARPFRYGNGAPGGFDSLSNLFHIYTQSPDGANNFAFYGQHSGDHFPSSFGATNLAAHFLAQTGDERVWFADYYRGNNLGLGNLIGAMPEPFMQEGMDPLTAPRESDSFVPRDVINFAGWSSSGDQNAKQFDNPSHQNLPTFKHPNYADNLIYMGKVGHPGALSNNRLMLSWGNGACNSYTGFWDYGWFGPNYEKTEMITLDTPVCDAGIYRATKIPSEHPSDLEMIVDSRDWHEIMARAVVPYSAIFNGADKPDLIARADTLNEHPELESGTPFGLLGAASITDRETFPREGIHFKGHRAFNLQGTDTIHYKDEDLCGVRILGVMPNRTRYPHKELFNLAGERVSILGEFPVQNKDAAGNAIMDASGRPDTSFLVKMPANMPYLMQSIDCDGRTLNTDMTWQSLRPSEQKTCGGCHVHSREERIKFKDSLAASSDYPTPHLGEGVVPLLMGKTNGKVGKRTVHGYGLPISFNRDIIPILQQRCTSCHSGSNAAGGLDLATLGTHGFPRRDSDPQTPSSWHCLVRDFKQECIADSKKFETGMGDIGTSRNYMFDRPQVSRYVRAFNSLGSLFYWKAAGERTDNNTDATFTDASDKKDIDIDFGAAHKHFITPEELGLISRWIDIGSSNDDPGEATSRDTQKPTLSLTAVINSGSISELRIGTVDLGSGIDPASLEVCIVKPSGDCDNMAGPAHMHGVTSVAYSEHNPAVEILARIADKAGNITEIRKSVSFLLNNPAPKPVLPVKVTVPDVTGKTEAVASSSLKALKLRVTRSIDNSESVAAGLVIKSNPAAGVIVSTNSTVNLLVSSGPASTGSIIVPDLTGKTQATAKSELEALGFNVVITFERSDTVATGLIIRSTPTLGASIPIGSTVTLVISSGKEGGDDTQAKGFLSSILMLILGS